MIQRWGARWLLGCIAIGAIGACHHLILVSAQATERERLDEQARQLVAQWHAVQSEWNRVDAEFAQLQLVAAGVAEEPARAAAAASRSSFVWRAAQSFAPLTRWSIGDASGSDAAQTLVLEGPFAIVLGFLREAALDTPARPLRRLTMRRQGEVAGSVYAELWIGRELDAAEPTEF